MSHLIIGAGNMGKRYADLLTKHFGRAVKIVDVDFSPSDIEPHESVLICTPPETHARLIELCADKPIFCEKPVITSTAPRRIPAVSMVSCNWRWCYCYPRRTIIRMGYRFNAHTKLDIIHFLDLYWEQYGEPDFCFFEAERNSIYASFAQENSLLGLARTEVELWDSPSPWTEFDGRLIHKRGPCEMFATQMKKWLEVLAGAPSPNPIETAIQRTSFLIQKWNTSPWNTNPEPSRTTPAAKSQTSATALNGRKKTTTGSETIQ